VLPAISFFCSLIAFTGTGSSGYDKLYYGSLYGGGGGKKRKGEKSFFKIFFIFFWGGGLCEKKKNFVGVGGGGGGGGENIGSWKTVVYNIYSLRYIHFSPHNYIIKA